ncbi:hypothetical protein [Lentilactobacillus sp. Marseille-Q4993]|uniref:hypothetical protein n=1 Tax=Lentilactobacillus sp. Marseille-Q4993 TaxID=3039492 RepID=UPI0024BC8276|nr:hypothetical protein [Lentilactobacillus sp. Marseille-Q4993]
MPKIFYNGKEVSKMFYNGKEVATAYYNGVKIYPTYLDAGTELLSATPANITWQNNVNLVSFLSKLTNSNILSHDEKFVFPDLSKLQQVEHGVRIQFATKLPAFRHAESINYSGFSGNDWSGQYSKFTDASLTSSATVDIPLRDSSGELATGTQTYVAKVSFSTVSAAGSGTDSTFIPGVPLEGSTASFEQNNTITVDPNAGTLLINNDVKMAGASDYSSWDYAWTGTDMQTPAAQMQTQIWGQLMVTSITAY